MLSMHGSYVSVEVKFLAKTGDPICNIVAWCGCHDLSFVELVYLQPQLVYLAIANRNMCKVAVSCLDSHL